MHDPTRSGNEFFRCDFCQRAWAVDLPMVEGHQGSLVCARCLTTAYRAVVLARTGTELVGARCTMCLENRDQHQWASPLATPPQPAATICERCIRQSASQLARDPEANWTKPGSAEQIAANTPLDDKA